MPSILGNFNSTVTGLITFTIGKAPMYLGPSFLHGSLRFRYFVERYVLSPTRNTFCGTHLLSASFGFLLLYPGLSLHCPRHFGMSLPSLPRPPIRGALEDILAWHEFYPSSHFKRGESCATMHRVVACHLSQWQESCPVRLLVIYIATQVLFHHCIGSFCGPFGTRMKS